MLVIIKEGAVRFSFHKTKNFSNKCFESSVVKSAKKEGNVNYKFR